MLRRLAVLALAVALAALHVASFAIGASQTTRVKTPKGLKSGLEIAVNPNTGDVLIAFSNKGQIQAALAKNKAKYVAKKAKPLSSGADAYRPTAAWDEEANEFLVAWDTGPADLAAATARSAVRAVGESAIGGRRVKAKTGKGLKPQFEIVNDGKTNLGPDLRRVPGGEVVMHFMQNADAAEPKVRLIRNLFRGEGDSAQNVGTLPSGLAAIEVSHAAYDDVLLGMNHYSGGIPTAMLARSDLTDVKLTRFESWTPTLFPAVTTGAGAVAILASASSRGLPRSIKSSKKKFLAKHKEPKKKSRLPGQARAVSCDELPQGQSWREAFLGLVSQNYQPDTPFGICATSNLVGPWPDPTDSGDPPEAVYGVAITENDGIVRLYDNDLDSIAMLAQLLTRSREVHEMRLLTLPDGERAILVWLEEKSGTNYEVWMHIFDLP